MHPLIDFGPEICQNLNSARKREWLITNGIGGYASGTIAGVLTRKYHGLLIAALNPPLGRTLLVSKLEELISYQGLEYPLFSNQFSQNNVSPYGFHYLKRFHLEGTTPVWTFEIGDAIIEKRIWMVPNENTTYTNYHFSNQSGSQFECRINALVNYRDHHSVTLANRGPHFSTKYIANGIQIQAGDDGTAYFLICPQGYIEIETGWYKGFFYAEEAYRGELDREDLYKACGIFAIIQPDQELTIIASTKPEIDINPVNAYAERLEYERNVLRTARLAPEKGIKTGHNNGYVISTTVQEQLALAADQFIVLREFPDGTQGHTVIAGYHWFGDWGRDTMISLPGLTLETGRSEITKSILRTYAAYIDRGMIPNRFPDYGELPEYNTVDATLWFIEALHRIYKVTEDKDLLEELYPSLEKIISWHIEGTRYGIVVDHEDYLLYAGQTGVQLTWMDAKVDDWVVTPRIGKPVEINALWYNALCCMSEFFDEFGSGENPYAFLSRRAKLGFQRFWNNKVGYCFDVLDTPDGNDPALRPNQLIPISLSHIPLTIDQSKSVLDICTTHLLTPKGLRSLAPFEDEYLGIYGGDRYTRDKAYHQGTVWAWLIGPYLLAHWNIYHDQGKAITILKTILTNLWEHGIGNISEIFDGTPPHTPRGCIAQAWSVSVIIQVMKLLDIWNSIKIINLK